MQHSFKPAEFKELRGFISIAALNNILAQANRANSAGIDSVCECPIRRTHGLPCAHEIVWYRQEGRPIPLSCIDPYWRKLDMVSASKMQIMKLNCEPELDIIAKKFKQLDGAAQLQMLRKLREIASPDSTSLEEPAKKMTGSRGRTSLKVDTSTRRDPSAFELVLSGQDSYSPGTGTPMSLVQKRQPRKKVICICFI